MPKCLLSGNDIGHGEPIIEPTKHLLPGDAGFITVAALKKAYNNTVVVEDLRKQVTDLRRKLGEE